MLHRCQNCKEKIASGIWGVQFRRLVLMYLCADCGFNQVWKKMKLLKDDTGREIYNDQGNPVWVRAVRSITYLGRAT